MNSPPNYEKEYLAVRYAVLTQSSDSKLRVEGYKKLIEICKRLKWILYRYY